MVRSPSLKGWCRVWMPNLSVWPPPLPLTTHPCLPLSLTIHLSLSPRLTIHLTVSTSHYQFTVTISIPCLYLSLFLPFCLCLSLSLSLSSSHYPSSAVSLPFIKSLSHCPSSSVSLHRSLALCLSHSLAHWFCYPSLSLTQFLCLYQNAPGALQHNPPL